MNMKFLTCKKCGNIIAMVKDCGSPISCCDEKMTEIIPGTVEAAKEKHIPVYELKGNTVCVTVGDVKHPMLDNHYIEWVAIQTSSGNQRKALTPGGEPEVCFSLCEGDELLAVYAYCNLHGLWMCTPAK